MIYISHRGNLIGKNIKEENKPEYITSALEKGFNVEIDVWNVNNNFFLGHDKPLYRINKKFLLNKKLWCHAKNIVAFYEMSLLNCHFYWHQDDDYTLTSNGYLWTFPGKILTKKSICVLPELSKKIKKFNCAGICSDYIERYVP